MHVIWPHELYFIVSNGIACKSKLYWKYKRKLEWKLDNYATCVYRWIRCILFISLKLHVVDIKCLIDFCSLSITLPPVQDEEIFDHWIFDQNHQCQLFDAKTTPNLMARLWRNCQYIKRLRNDNYTKNQFHVMSYKSPSKVAWDNIRIFFITSRWKLLPGLQQFSLDLLHFSFYILLTGY